MFGIDDAAAIVAVAETVVEGFAEAAESAELLGDGVAESAVDANIESAAEICTQNTEPIEVLGDGCGENTYDSGMDFDIDKHYSEDVNSTDTPPWNSKEISNNADVSISETHAEVNNQIQDESQNNTSPRKIKTINDSLEGQNHSETGVPFNEKTVETDTGEKITGVFPEFDSKFDAHLPEDMLKESDPKQFNECNKQLKDAIESDPELAKQFDEEQLEQIKNGDTSDGYTWHHNEEKGKMQLVDSETHAKTGHTGGRSIWGGGTEYR